MNGSLSVGVAYYAAQFFAFNPLPGTIHPRVGKSAGFFLGERIFFAGQQK
jgi:hypothetical protein